MKQAALNDEVCKRLLEAEEEKKDGKAEEENSVGENVKNYF